jgi:hypothetical protein
MISGFAVLFALAYLGVEIYSPWSCEMDDTILVGLTWIVTIGIYDVISYAKKVVMKYAPVITNKIRAKKSNSEEVIEKTA